MEDQWKTYNPNGSKRVIVTKELPGTKWLDILQESDCRVDVGQSRDIVSNEEIKSTIGEKCDGVIGQLTEDWNEELFEALNNAGGTAYSNYAVGYDNVSVDAASKNGIAVGNTPGVLTETTAEMAVALTYSVARRVVEADEFMRNGKYDSWLPDLFLGNRLWKKTVGVIGAGRIGSAYARMMVQGEHMDLIYYDIYQNKQLEKDVKAFAKFLESHGEEPVSITRADSIEEVLKTADVLSLHPVLNDKTFHMITGKELAMMKKDAILINVSRGPVIKEADLVEHCRNNPDFRAGLDVFEDEPEMEPGLPDLSNVTIVPHIASATRWTREGMAVLAASNVAGILNNYPAWEDEDISPFLTDDPPKAAPSIINAQADGVPSNSG
ncbi:MAG: Glyoxylate/hydroxypyruvate reductase B [Candidatus Marinimicrobia bacterium]|nr:Glyoxylate/hydroxypyruvate reductase B [Candidatus Neomarinimicrobiota bacterium]